jgi:hypothetical protein
MIKQIKKSYDDCTILEKMAIERGFAKTIDAKCWLKSSKVFLVYEKSTWRFKNHLQKHYFRSRISFCGETRKSGQLCWCFRG